MKRRRALPSWMSTKERKEHEPPQSRRKRKGARAVFYCMNETELLEAAASCLTNGACEDVTPPADREVGDKAGDATAKIREQRVSSNTNTEPATEEESSDRADALETTCVSETDLDVTELETLPRSKSPRRQTPEGQTSGRVQDRSRVVDAEEREKCAQKKAEAAEEDDALKLVREIFFTS